MSYRNFAANNPGRPVRPSAPISQAAAWTSYYVPEIAAPPVTHPRPMFNAAALTPFQPIVIHGPTNYVPPPTREEPKEEPKPKKQEKKKFERIPAPRAGGKTNFHMENIEHDNVLGSSIKAVAPVESPVKQEDLPGMLRYGAACSNSRVCRIVFESSNITMKLDTKENITIPPDADIFKDVCNITSATQSLVLVFTKNGAGACMTANWENFTRTTTHVSISGKIPRGNLLFILHQLKATSSLNFHALEFNGKLQQMVTAFAPVVENLYFDARRSACPTLIDNVSSLYQGYYGQQHKYSPCLRELTLIVNDFAQDSALQTQVQRLTEMLKDDTSSVVVCTTIPGNNGIFEDLNVLEFHQTHAGFMEADKNALERYIYWSTRYNSREIVFGFRDRYSESLKSPSLMPVVPMFFA